MLTDSAHLSHRLIHNTHNTATPSTLQLNAQYKYKYKYNTILNTNTQTKTKTNTLYSVKFNMIKKCTVVQLRANKGGSLSDCNQFHPSFAALDSN